MKSIESLAREAGLLPDNSHPTAQTRYMAQKVRAIEHFAALVREQPPEWRPIETAPKDGTFVIVWPPTWNGVTSCAHWNADEYLKKPQPYWSRTDDLGRKKSREKPPTHWLPLPPAPEVTE